MKLVSYSIISAIIAVAILWSINELSILAGAQESQGPEAMFIIPLCIFYLFISIFFVYPVAFLLSKKIGNLKAGILSSFPLAIIIGTILYDPKVDNSGFLTIILISVFIGLPLFVGGLLGKQIINLIWQKNDT